MLNLEIPAECVLKLLWVHLFLFGQEEDASLQCRADRVQLGNVGFIITSYILGGRSGLIHCGYQRVSLFCMGFLSG